MAKAIPNGEKIDTSTYEICLEQPTQTTHTRRWRWVLFICLMIAGWGLLYYKMPDLLSIPTGSVTAGLVLVWDGSDEEKCIEEIIKLVSSSYSEIYTKSPFSPIYKIKSSDLGLEEDSSGGQRAFYQYDDEASYGIYLGRETLKQKIATLESSPTVAKKDNFLSRMTAYSDDELFARLLSIRTDDIEMGKALKETLENYDAIDGVWFEYEWPAERHHYSNSFYTLMIEKFDFSFDFAAKALAYLFFLGTLVINIIIAFKIVPAIGTIFKVTYDAMDDEDDGAFEQSNSAYRVDGDANVDPKNTQRSDRYGDDEYSDYAVEREDDYDDGDDEEYD